MKQQQNILDGRFKSTPVHVDGITKGKSQRSKGNVNEILQGKSKEKPPTATKRKMLIKSAKGALENCTRSECVLHASPSVTSVQNRSLGAGL